MVRLHGADDFDNFNVEAKCKSGYKGSLIVNKCSSPDKEYTISGLINI